MQTGLPFEIRYAYDYYSLSDPAQGSRIEAVKVWQQAADRFGLTSYLPSPANLVVNGISA